MLRVLAIIPKFFLYEEHIKAELQKLGYDVCLVLENPDEFSGISKIMIKVLGSKEKYYNSYFIKKIGNNKFDIVLVIKGSFLSIDVIDLIKKKSPNAKLYMYQWDSVRNNENARDIAKYFDKVSTFDIEDAKEYGWNYRPLFFLKQTERDVEREYRISFIATMHSQRLKIYNILRSGYQNEKCFFYLFSKRSHYIKEKYLRKNPDFMGIKDSKVMFKSLSLDQVNEILAKSHIVVDYTHPMQTGFTMRTIESVGHRCKLVTK